MFIRSSAVQIRLFDAVLLSLFFCITEDLCHLPLNYAIDPVGDGVESTAHIPMAYDKRAVPVLVIANKLRLDYDYTTVHTIITGPDMI